MGLRKFRDGKREIPDYMDDLMTGLKTEKMTFEEAIKAMNREMVMGHVDRVVDRQIANHFRGGTKR